MSALPIHFYNKNLIAWYCPGCKYEHAVTINPEKNSLGAGWNWNRNLYYPSFTPSVRCYSDYNARITGCHCFITNGKIQFLSDCQHELAGQIVDMVPWE
jgi:hypothetical protein